MYDRLAETATVHDSAPEVKKPIDITAPVFFVVGLLVGLLVGGLVW